MDVYERLDEMDSEMAIVRAAELLFGMFTSTFYILCPTQRVDTKVKTTFTFNTGNVFTSEGACLNKALYRSNFNGSASGENILP